MTKVRQSTSRRGVLLLVILGLLAMFGLIAITFALVTGHMKRGAVAAGKFEQYSDPPDRVVYQAMMQVLRGTNNPASVSGRIVCWRTCTAARFTQSQVCLIGMRLREGDQAEVGGRWAVV